MRKQILIILVFAVAGFLSCKKDSIPKPGNNSLQDETPVQTAQRCDGCDMIIYDPGDGGGGQGGGSGNSYSGGSNCDGGYFTVTHSNVFTYNLSYSIVNGSLSSWSLTGSFHFPMPSMSGSLISKNVSYSSIANTVTVTCLYSVTTQISLVDVNGNPVTYYNTETINTSDVIETCANIFHLG